MNLAQSTLYTCPVCQHPLSQMGRTLTCALGHSFDLSTEGYVNLLLANQKKSLEPGDSVDMVKARHSFLSKGYYDTLAQSVCQLVDKYHHLHKGTTQPSLLDAGCGEGYYSDFLARHAFSQGAYWGIDMSKPAIQRAAKRNHSIQWCVGNIFSLPYQNAQFQTLISIFSPICASEFHRVLVSGGIIILVSAGELHLHALAQVIYEQVRPHQGNDAVLAELPQFKQLESRRITQSLQLTHTADILALFQMTPYYWHAPLNKRQHVEHLESLTTSIDFRISVFQAITPKE